MQKPIWTICTTHMFIEVHLLIQVALIPIITEEFHLGLLEASLVATVPSLIALLMNLPSGFLADRFSTNHLLFASMFIEGVSALLVSQTRDFWTLVLGVSMMRISSPIYHVSGLSQISRLAPPQQISRSIGVHNALGNVGTAGGLVSLSFFLATVGWRWTYLFWAVPIMAWALIVLKSSQLKTERPETSKTQKGHGLGKLRLILSSGLLMFLIVISIREVGATSTSTFMTTFFVDNRKLPEFIASLVFSMGPFVGIFGSLSGGYLGERMGAQKALSLAILGCAVSVLILPFVSQVLLLVLVYSAYALFNNAVWSPMNTMVASLTPRSDRGLSYSLYFFTEGLVASFTPTMAAALIEHTDIWFIFPISAAFLTASLVALQLLGRKKKWWTALSIGRTPWEKIRNVRR